MGEFVLLSNSLAALSTLAHLSLPVFVITNQSAINRGLVHSETLEDIHTHMIEVIRQAGGCIHDVFVCPHRPDENCDCRKPRPGLLLQAADKYQLDLSRSYVVGDALTDMLAGAAVGARLIMVLTGRGKAQARLLEGEGLDQVMVVDDLLAAVQLIERLEVAPDPATVERSS